MQTHSSWRRPVYIAEVTPSEVCEVHVSTKGLIIVVGMRLGYYCGWACVNLLVFG